MYKVIQSGIVVLAPQNNPAIMTPQFAIEYEIVPLDWIIKKALATSQVNHLIWENGYTISSVEKTIIFQYDVIEGGPEPFAKDCQIKNIAEKYISQLSKLKYTNVGINFVSVSDEGEPKTAFENKLLSPKLGDLKDVDPDQLRLSRKFKDAAIQNLSITPIKHQTSDELKNCLEFRGNLHFDIGLSSIEGSWKRTLEIISSWDSFYDSFSNMVDDVREVIEG